MAPQPLEYRSQEIPDITRAEAFCYLAPGVTLLVSACALTLGLSARIELADWIVNGLGLLSFMAFIACFPACSACWQEIRSGKRYRWLWVALVLNSLPPLLVVLLLALSVLMLLIELVV